MIVIDTGAPTEDPLRGVPDWFIDLMPDGTPHDRIIHQYAYNLIGKLAEYRSMKFARKHLLMHWGFLQRLADTHPEIFDEALGAYAEAWAASSDPRRAVPDINGPNPAN